MAGKNQEKCVSELCIYQEKPYVKKKKAYEGANQNNKINCYKMDVKEKEAQGRFEEEGSRRLNMAQLIQFLTSELLIH